MQKNRLDVFVMCLWLWHINQVKASMYIALDKKEMSNSVVAV